MKTLYWLMLSAMVLVPVVFCFLGGVFVGLISGDWNNYYAAPLESWLKWRNDRYMEYLRG